MRTARFTRPTNSEELLVYLLLGENVSILIDFGEHSIAHVSSSY